MVEYYATLQNMSNLSTNLYVKKQGSEQCAMFCLEIGEIKNSILCIRKFWGEDRNS
jgi:hypothetical protein